MPVLSPPVQADRLLDSLISEALARRATDIHITPGQGTSRVGFRVDGLLHPRTLCLASRECELLQGRLKVLANLNIAQRRQPQAGGFMHSADALASPVELRVSFLPTIDGESTAIRLLTESARALPLGELGMRPATLEHLRALGHRPSGLLLVSGPTGSGKTTTLCALAEELARSVRRVLTVEDPVERRIAGATQVCVNREEGLDFAAALRGVLRHDPDVIMVGEIRDAETAAIALAAGLAGHLVLASIHARGPLSALERLVHLRVDRIHLVAVLAGVLTQRLVRLTCPNCAGGECPRCGGTGFRGRSGVFDLMEPDATLRRRLLARDPDLAAGQDDLAGIAAHAGERIESGETTLAEVTRVLACHLDGRDSPVAVPSDGVTRSRDGNPERPDSRSTADVDA